MNETATTPAAPQQADPKQTAENIVKGIQNKANGRAPSKAEAQAKDATKETPVDPNAGKEKYIVDGRDIWLSPEQARAYVQKGIAFEPRVSELDRLKNEAQQFLETLKKDPARILFNPQIGLTPESVFEKIMTSDRINDATKETVGKWYYQNVIEPSKLSPEQLKAREDARWREQREQFDKVQAEEKTKEETSQRVEMAMNQIKANISEAMKESGLPNNDTPLGAEMARMVADVMRVAHMQRQALTPKQAIDFVKKRIKEVQVAYYDSLDDENLVKEIGEKNAEKVKKYFLKLVKEAGKEIPANQKAAQPRKNERRVMGLDDFHDYLDELKKKG